MEQLSKLHKGKYHSGTICAGVLVGLQEYNCLDARENLVRKTPSLRKLLSKLLNLGNLLLYSMDEKE